MCREIAESRVPLVLTDTIADRSDVVGSTQYYEDNHVTVYHVQMACSDEVHHVISVSEAPFCDGS